MGWKRKSDELNDICSHIKEDDVASWNNLRQWFKHSTSWRERVCHQKNVSNFKPLLHVFQKKNPPLDVVQTIVTNAPELLKIKFYCFESLAIHTACEYGPSKEVIQALIQGYPEGVRVQDQLSYLPIHYLCHSSVTSEILNLIIDAYPESIIMHTSKGQLPIHMACCHKPSLEVLRIFLEAYPEGVRHQDNDGLLPIHWACRTKASLEALHVLIEVFPNGVKVQDKFGNLPIHYSLWGKPSLEILNLLVQAYPGCSGEKNGNGKKPLDMLKGGYWVKTEDKKGKIPLHHAYAKGLSMQLVELLVDAYPEGVARKDNNGKTPDFYKTPSFYVQQDISLSGAQDINVNSTIETAPQACCVQDRGFHLDTTQTEPTWKITNESKTKLWQQVESDIKEKLSVVAGVTCIMKETTSELAKLKSKMESDGSQKLKSGIFEIKVRLSETEAKIKAEMSEIKDQLTAEMKALIKSAVTEMKAQSRAEIAEMKTQLKSEMWVQKKAEIAEMKTLLRAEMKAQKKDEITEMKTQLRAEMKAIIKSVITEMKTQMKAEKTEMRAEMKQERSEVRADVSDIKNILCSLISI